MSVVTKPWRQSQVYFDSTIWLLQGGDEGRRERHSRALWHHVELEPQDVKSLSEQFFLMN